MAPRFQSAVRKMMAAGRLSGATGLRRGNHATAHATDGGQAADASMYRREGKMGGSLVADGTATIRRGIDAVKELCQELRRGTVSGHADLSGEEVGETGARLLSFVLAGEHAHRLRSLSLRSSAVGNRGASFLAGALRRNWSLTALDMSECGLGTSGAEELAAALTVGCPALRYLSAARNELGPLGVRALLSAAPHHGSLAHLNLERSGASRGMRPLFCSGDDLELTGGRVVHVRSARQVPRADGGPTLEGRRTTLVALHAQIGQVVDLRIAAKPPLSAAFVNVSSNGVVEALCRMLGQPLRALRVVCLGGNPFGAQALEEVSRALSQGPNAQTVNVAFQVRPVEGSDLARLTGEAAKLAAGDVAAHGDDLVDPVVALTESMRYGRAGTWAPEPSLCSELDSSWGDSLLGEEHEPPAESQADELADSALSSITPPQPMAITLPQSMKLNGLQTVSRGMRGARVSSLGD
jgi:hypothetical protein